MRRHKKECGRARSNVIFFHIYISHPEHDQMYTCMAEFDQMCGGFDMFVLAGLCELDQGRIRKL